MKIIIGSDSKGKHLKQYLIEHLTEKFEILDVTKDKNYDCVDTVKNIVEELKKNDNALGIAIDEYGAGSFMAATKHKGIVAAQVSDERSAYMTREHNNARIITIGSEIVGEKLALNIATEFLNGKYEGGRHQIRVDMLNKMA